jgi:MmgE/PrpD N-terminal domain
MTVEVGVQASVTRTLAEFAAGVTYSGLPVDVRHKTAQVICDTVACMFGGTAVVTGRLATTFISRLGGVPEATVVGGRGKTTAVNAAYANASLANALDFDETFMNGSHPASLAVVAALALGEAGHANGGDIIAAVAAGYDVAARIAIATESPSTFGVDRAPVSSGSWQTYAAIAAAGRILGLDADQMTDAFGIGGVMAPMPTQSVAFSRPGGYPLIKYLPTGWATQAGITAALLAADGMTGPTSILDGDKGFWRMQGFGSCDFDYLVEALGEKWWILDAALKPWPCCRAIHPYLTAFDALLAGHRFTVDDIDEVRLIGNIAGPPPAGTVRSVGADFSDPDPDADQQAVQPALRDRQRRAPRAGRSTVLRRLPRTREPDPRLHQADHDRAGPDHDRGAAQPVDRRAAATRTTRADRRGGVGRRPDLPLGRGVFQRRCLGREHRADRCRDRS